MAARSMNTNSCGTRTGPFSFSARCTPKASRRPYSAGFTPSGDGALAILDHRPEDEARPDLDIDQLVGDTFEPRLRPLHDQAAIIVLQAMVEVDHPADELCREDANAAVIEQIDAGRLARLPEPGVVAEMRVASG